MEKFNILSGVAAPLMKAGIDTGTIIPSLWLRLRSYDLAEKLFHDLRYDEAGRENPGFVLNQPRYRKSRILLAGPDFGCGSSREGAVWALMRFGIRCVIAPSFGEIFYDNACQNGMLPLVMPRAEIEALAAWVEAANDPVLTVDLERNVIVTGDGVERPISVPADRRLALLEGLDETDLIQRHAAEITGFQERHRGAQPWLFLRERG